MRTKNELQFLTKPELDRLFSVIASRRDKAIFLVAFRHGLRASEVGLLKRTDVDLEIGRIFIHRLKGSFSGEYPMAPDEIKAIRNYLRTRSDSSPYLFISSRLTPIDRTTLHLMMRKYGALAEIPPEKRHFHVLKHSCATHLLARGVDIRSIQDWLGHKQIINTLRYAQLINTARDDLARKVWKGGL